MVLGYAQALFSIAEAEGSLERVEDELYRFSKIVDSDSDLREALTDIGLPLDRKKAMLQDLLAQKADPQTIKLVEFIVEQGHAREMGAIIEGLAEIAAERRRHALADVRTAVPLSDTQKRRLAEALSAATGLTLELKVIVDPTVIGGVIARVGDQVIDGTVRSRLTAARDELGSV
jgi:F-type H+-transporting ATPase subunit delta